MKDEILKKVLICPKCLDALTFSTDAARCGCSKYKVTDGRIFFVVPPDDVPMPKRPIEYATNSAHWSDWRTSNFDFLQWHLVDVTNESRVLDVAAGRSPFREFNDRFPNLVSTDFYPFDLVEVVHDASAKLPFADNSFDVIISSNVMEHMPDPQFSLAEYYRVLKPGGKLLCITPFFMLLHDEPYDFTRFTKYLIERLMNQVGFKNCKVENLSNFYDVIDRILKDFYMTLVNETKYAPTLAGRMLKYYARSIRISQLWFLHRMAFLYKRVKSERYPKGYGWVGYK